MQRIFGSFCCFCHLEEKRDGERVGLLLGETARRLRRVCSNEAVLDSSKMEDAFRLDLSAGEPWLLPAVSFFRFVWILWLILSSSS